MLYKEAYSPIHTKVKLSSDLEFRNEFKLFPRQHFEIKISCFSYFFCYYKNQNLWVNELLEYSHFNFHLSNVGSKIARYHF